MPEKRKAIIVAGMHRSGTSAVTRVVNLLGADLASSPDPAGHRQRAGTLGIAGGPGAAQPDPRRASVRPLFAGEFSPVMVPEPVPRRHGSSASRRWFDRNTPRSNLFVLKDPRIVLFIPLWIAALNRLAIEPHFIIPFRHPLAVAASLEARERTARQRQRVAARRTELRSPAALYAGGGKVHARMHQRSFVSFERLLADWRRELTRVGSQLAIGWPRRRLRRRGRPLFSTRPSRSRTTMPADEARCSEIASIRRSGPQPGGRPTRRR